MRLLTTPLTTLAKRICLALLTCGVCLFAVVEAAAQKRQAVIILRAPGGSVSVAPCDGATELVYQLATDVKFNNKDEVRMASNMGSASESTLVSRKAYEETRKMKMKELFALKWGTDGVLYAVSVEGQSPVPDYPR